MMDMWRTDDPEQPVAEATPPRATAERRRRSPGRKLLLFAILPLVCLCSFFTFRTLGFYFRIAAEGVAGNEEWERKADQLMHAMREGEIERAYSMFAPAAQEEITLAELEELATSSQLVLFDGYRELELESWEITRNGEGTFATAEGSVIYSGGYTGRWTFTFIQDEEWKIYNFYVWIPSDKMDAFNQQ
ncbi:MAG: hypothetical protein R3272_06140 [Candidatus Promineifilaceae bacterium]|nr:hypothetical protein [Candidatus Promineifilaceae bacterium]